MYSVLNRSDDDFVIMKESTDTDSYKIILLDCNLFVPIAQLSAPLFSEIGSTFSHEAITMHFRRIEIHTVSLPRSKEEFSSDILFTDDMPCRIIVCFVETKNKTGSQTTNPFDFQRAWKATQVSEEENQSSSLRERALEEKINSMQEKLQKFESLFNLDDEMLRQIQAFQESRKSPSGRGKRSSSLQEGPSIFSRIRSSLGSQNRHSPTPSSHHSTSPPPSYREIEDFGDPPLIFVKQVELLLNGAPLDQLETRETFEDCMVTYWRMFQMGGFGRTLFTNGITYDAFRYFLSIFQNTVLLQ